MPHTLSSFNGSSLVPDISSGVNVLAQGIIFKQKQNRVDQRREEAGGLIEQLGEPGVSSGQEQKTLLRLSQLLNPQQLAAVRSILEKGDLEELAAFQKQSDDAFKFAASLEGLSHPEQINAIKTEFQRLSVLKDSLPPEQQIGIQKQMDELMKLGQKNKGDLDVAIFRQKVLSTDTKSAAKFATARRERQRQKRTADAAFLANLPVEKQAIGVIQLIQEGVRKGENVEHLERLQRMGPRDRNIALQGIVSQARSLESFAKPPKLTKGEPGDTFFDPQGNIKFQVPGGGDGGIDVAKANPKDFTGPSLDKATGPGGSFADLELSEAAKTKLNQTGSFVTGDSTLFKDQKNNTFIATPVTDKKTGETKLNINPIKGPGQKPGVVASRALGETPGEKQVREIGTAGGKAQATADVDINTVGEIEKQKARGKGKEARLQEFINNGITVSGTAANIKRSIELLKSVPTGGIDAVKLKFKQFFGVEGGDLAELAQNFMKNVLKQLKPTFGAQFTEREGRLLIDIEAGFSKSTEGNIQLLGQALKIIQKAANRGIKAAEEAGDFTAADAIRENMDFSLNPEPKPGQVGRFQVEVE